MEMLAIIVGSTGGVIACCAVLGIMLVRHVQPFGCHDVNEVIEGMKAFGFGSMLQISLAGSYWFIVHIFIQYSPVNGRLNTSVYSTYYYEPLITTVTIRIDRTHCTWIQICTIMCTFSHENQYS